MFLANIMPDIAVTLLSLDEGLVCVKDSIPSLTKKGIIKIIIGEILIRKWKIIFRFMMEIIMPFKSINIKTKIF